MGLKNLFLFLLVPLLLCASFMAFAGQYNADNCEFYLNSVRVETTKHYGVLRVRFLATAKLSPWTKGTPIQFGVWYTYQGANQIWQEQIVTPLKSTPFDRAEIEVGIDLKGVNPELGTSWEKHPILFAYFLDVQNEVGQVDRFWVSNHGQNFSFDSVMRGEWMRTSTPYGMVDYVLERSSELFFQKRSCLATY